MNTPEQNQKLMDKRAQDLALLLNKLQWPEILGPYFPRATAPHVVQGTDYTVAVNYNTAMFSHRETCVHHFIDLPEDKDLDLIAWLAVQFMDWVVEHRKEKQRP